MKMARASEQDLKAALDVSRVIEDLEKGYMPGSDDDERTEFFDRDDREQCRRALDAILQAAQKGSIFRVTFGMAVLLDPRNKLLDPDADTLEIHPEHARNAEDAARYRRIRRGQHLSVVDGIGNTLRAEDLDAAVDTARKGQGGAT